MRFIDKQIVTKQKAIKKTDDINKVIPHIIKVLHIRERKDMLIVLYKAYTDITYDDLVNGMVRDRYTESEEFAILRKAITEKTEEYELYNLYVEACKKEAKEWIANRK